MKRVLYNCFSLLISLNISTWPMLILATNTDYYQLSLVAHYYFLSYEKALESIQKAVKLQPIFAQGWLFSPFLHEQEGRFQDALSCYELFLNLVGHDLVIEQKIIILKKIENVCYE